MKVLYDLGGMSNMDIVILGRLIYGDLVLKDQFPKQHTQFIKILTKARIAEFIN